MTCDCFEAMNFDGSSHDQKVSNERLESLRKGNKFVRSALLGLTSKEITVHLSDDYSTIKWKIDKTTWTSEEFGEIDLTTEVKKLKTVGENGLQIIGQKDDQVLLEIKHEDSSIRDKWVVVINELLQSWIDDPSLKPKVVLNSAGTSNKSEYFKKREEEIKAREKENAERKAKYASGGMKMTAQIMAERGTTQS
jgi:hypothetical protein